MSQLFAVRTAPPVAEISLNEERREVLESVWEVLALEHPGADELAACSYLLARLSRSLGTGADRLA